MKGHIYHGRQPQRKNPHILFNSKHSWNKRWNTKWTTKELNDTLR